MGKNNFFLLGGGKKKCLKIWIFFIFYCLLFKFIGSVYKVKYVLFF